VAMPAVLALIGQGEIMLELRPRLRRDVRHYCDRAGDGDRRPVRRSLLFRHPHLSGLPRKHVLYSVESCFEFAGGHCRDVCVGVLVCAGVAKRSATWQRGPDRGGVTVPLAVASHRFVTCRFSSRAASAWYSQSDCFSSSAAATRVGRRWRQRSPTPRSRND
jgi:hypothetical protein